MILPPRLRLVLMGLVACALAAVIGASLAARNTGEPAPAGLVGFKRPVGVPPGDFALTDQDGERVRLRDLRGDVVLLTFLYATCQDTCPQQAQTIRGALDRLGEDVPAFAISVDPPRDTPRAARTFLARERVTGRMRFLLGTRAELEPVWKEYGVQPQGEGFEHSAYVLLIDKAGRQRVSFPFSALTPEGLANDLAVLRTE